jgi:hypothetical protein
MVVSPFRHSRSRKLQRRYGAGGREEYERCQSDAKDVSFWQNGNVPHLANPACRCWVFLILGDVIISGHAASYSHFYMKPFLRTTNDIP